MYNHYKSGTPAWWAMQEAIDASKQMGETQENVEQILGQLVESVDEIADERDQIQEERDQLELDLEAAEEKLKESPIDFNKLIELLDNVKLAGQGLVTYAESSEKKLREQYDVQESDSDSSGGTADDGGS